MTIASVLLALLTATSSPASDSTGPSLLDFHAEWCGPCHKVRPAVEQLIRKGYPIKTIDIDQEPELQQRYHVDSVPTFIVVDGSGTRDRSNLGPSVRRRAGAVLQGGGGQGAAAGQLECPRRLARATAAPAVKTTTTTRAMPSEQRPADARPSLECASEPEPPSRPSPIPSRGKPWSASGSSATARPASDRARSSTARPRNRSS